MLCGRTTTPQSFGAAKPCALHSNARSGEWPAWFPFLVFRALAGACQRHGVGGFIVEFIRPRSFVSWVCYGTGGANRSMDGGFSVKESIFIKGPHGTLRSATRHPEHSPGTRPYARPGLCLCASFKLGRPCLATAHETLFFVVLINACRGQSACVASSR